MKKQLDNTALWNEAAKAGAWLGAVSVGCLALKEASALTDSTFLVQAAAIILWAVEFFGCILLMKKLMLDLRDHYEGVKIEDTYRLGRRAALLSGLLLASAEALVIMKMPAEGMDTLLSQLTGSMQLTTADRENLEGVLDKLPVFTFFFQWLYCWLYGSLLSAILSRYIFLQKLFGGFPPQDSQTPDEQ